MDAASLAHQAIFTAGTVNDFVQFDAIIDVRSPAEFALDHVPGAVNFPVLDDQERAQIGTLHKQVSPFAARRAGAALVAQRIGRMLTATFFERERTWRPLVMCWRGGKRSSALTHVLRQIGWPAAQLDGGYRAYRALVNQHLCTLPAQLRYVVIAGRTGCGKSRLLKQLAQLGTQVLDLEDLANHRGSVLGAMPQAPQPSQKWFESQVLQALLRMSSAQPVFVESESKKIGDLRVPETLMQSMRASPCAIIEADLETRTQLLMEEYQHFLQDAASLNRQLDCLKALHGAERIAHWKTLGEAAQWHALVHDLLLNHYDVAYDRSIRRNFLQFGVAQTFTLRSAQEPDFHHMAQGLVGAYCGATTEKLYVSSI
jgi:tRNA 2-selenouridine synthase